MFGYVTAHEPELKVKEFHKYKGYYCGLCQQLKRNYGHLGQLTLTYDMTFLTLLLSSLYEPDEQSGARRCAVHPLRPRAWWQNRITRYAAAMNTLLAYDKCLDDWQDARNLLRRAEAQLLAPAARRAAADGPRQSGAVARQLRQLAALEQPGLPFSEDAAACFGNLMAELFVYQEDRWAPALRRFGVSLGKFLYFLDAACDLADDTRRGRYNPLIPLHLASGRDFAPQLRLLIADAAAEFERLPLMQDAALLRNVLYLGVWQQFSRHFPT
mgnify:CR=1 FL=1